MAVHGDYKEPKNKYQDKQMNHGVKKEWKEDYQKNKYQTKEKHGEKMTYQQKEKDCARTKYQQGHYYRNEAEKMYDQEKNYGRKAK